jgi:hypothetical protein
MFCSGIVTIGVVQGLCSILSTLLVDLPRKPKLTDGLAAGAIAIIPVVIVTLAYRNANPRKRPRQAPPYLLFHQPPARIFLDVAPEYHSVDDIWVLWVLQTSQELTSWITRARAT